MHWLPAVAPEPVDDEEASRLVGIARKRLGSGDSAAVVSRDLLLAGVPPWMVRTALGSARAARSSRNADARAFSLMTFLGGRLWGTTDRSEPGSDQDAESDIQRWETRFGPAQKKGEP